jgi:exosortase
VDLADGGVAPSAEISPIIRTSIVPSLKRPPPGPSGWLFAILGASHMLDTKAKAAALAALAGFVVLYWDVLARLAQDWLNDDNYSHGILIIPLALYFVWERRQKLAVLPPSPSALGLVVVAGGLSMLVAGLLGAELFLTRVSILVTLTGSVLFILGWQALRILAFPLAFLLLMIPIPAIIFNQIAFPLQLLASQAGEMGLNAAGVPVLREGNVMFLANTALEVAEACSGIRSLISLLTLGILFGYFTDTRSWMRVAIALATIPIAIFTNGLRVAGTGIAAHYIGPEAAEGFFHTFSGWLVFVVAFILMFLLTKILLRLLPPPRQVSMPMAAA